MPLPEAALDANGYVVEPGISTVESLLNDAQLAMFADAEEGRPLYIQTVVLIHSTNGQTVNAKPTDHITIGASAHFIIDIDFEDGDEEE